MDVINSLEDLRIFREEALAKHKMKETAGAVQIFVGMGTCGIAVGAREIMKAILDYIEKNQVENVSVTQTGCIGLCGQEPILQVVKGGSERISYGKVSPEIAKKIMKSHVVEGNIFKDNVIQL
jgi:(2Fe-2S) ferredoxin